MIAVDTNVIVRLLVADDRPQADQAEALFRKGTVLIPKTVLVEAEWVLRAAYRFSPGEIAAGLRRLLGLPGVAAEDPAAIERALDWYGRGMDFADALHLASSARAGGFATFDRRLARRAKALTTSPGVVEP